MVVTLIMVFIVAVVCGQDIGHLINTILSEIGEFICNFFNLKNVEPRFDLQKPFIVSEYYDRIEKAQLEILEKQEPVSQVIVLWWGLDGLRLNEDGSMEWISRKKKRQEVVEEIITTPLSDSRYISMHKYSSPYPYRGWEIRKLTRQYTDSINFIPLYIAENKDLNLRIGSQDSKTLVQEIERLQIQYAQQE